MPNQLKINTLSGLLEPVCYQASPHHDARAPGVTIDMIVIHGISLPPGEFGSSMIEQFFCGSLDCSSHPYLMTIAHLKVSAHLLIKRKGEIIQFVPFHQRAWHAGVSVFRDRTSCNDFSIGIELEGTDTLPYETVQYEQLIKIIKLLMITYPDITQDRIVGHSDIAPGRKTDPGPHFEWTYLKGITA